MLPNRTRCLLLITLCVPLTLGAESLPPGARARLGTTDLWHGPAVTSLAFAPDGKTFYSLSKSDAVVRRWDAATGREARAFAHKERVTEFALSRNGRLLAAAGTDRTVYLWNTENGEALATWPRKLRPQALAFSNDGKTLAVLPGDEPDVLSLLDAATGKETHKLKLDISREDNIRRIRFRQVGGRGVIDLDDDERNDATVVFSPDGRHLAVNNGSTLTLWDLTTNKKSRRYDTSRSRGTGLAFSPDGQTIYTLGDGLQRWEIGSIEPLEPFKGAEQLAWLAVSADGKVLAAVGGNSVCLWDAAGKSLHTLNADGDGLRAVACSADGKTVVTGNNDGLIRVWDAESGKERLLPGARPGFATLAARDDGTFVSADWHGLTHWSADGKVAGRVKLDAEQSADLALSRDGRTLALRREDGEVRLLDAASGEKRVTLEGKGRKNCSLVFSPDGRSVGVMEGSFTRPLCVFDARTGKEVRQLAGHAQTSSNFAFLPDGRTLLTSADSLCLWELATGKPRRVIAWEGTASAGRDEDYLDQMMARRGDDSKYVASPHYLAFSPDGRRLAMVTARSSVYLIDLQAGKRVARLEGFDQNVMCLTFSPDGKLLVAGDADRLVYLWDAATGKEIGTLAGHRGPVRQVTFSEDGKTLVTTSDDLTALVWDVAASLDAIRQAHRTAPATHSLDQLWADLGGDDPQLADVALRELESRPKEALPMLQERLRPAAEADAKLVARWVAGLDDGDFAVREKAFAELSHAGEQARAALEEALRGKPSEEVKRRAAELLKKLDERVYAADVVRDLRALEALEKIGGPEALKALELMASGAPADPRTQDAKAARERLRRK
jgi:WD40 repeat protein